ncbi:MAG: hypothetical protein AAFY56_13585 [Pseudomonadota bacterium]
MDKALSFFRLFDLAFFAPGALLVGVLFMKGWFQDLLVSSNLAVVLFGIIGVIYVTGLAIHSAQRVLHQWLLHQWLLHQRLGTKPSAEQGTVPSWYQKLPLDPRLEMAFYFWYMRTTCWNVALSLVIVLVFLIPNPPSISKVLLFLSAGVAAALIYRQGWDFDRAMRRALNSSGDADTLPAK